jgi:lipoate-protein ligase A
VLAPGCLNYSLRFSMERFPALRDVRGSYRLILGALMRALAVRGLEIRGLADIALDNCKVSGNAQHRDSESLLHHGTLLYAFDARLAMRYLRPPARQPEYRAGREHVEFLGNLPLTAAEIRARLARFYFDPMANR